MPERDTLPVICERATSRTRRSRQMWPAPTLFLASQRSRPRRSGKAPGSGSDATWTPISHVAA